MIQLINVVFAEIMFVSFPALYLFHNDVKTIITDSFYFPMVVDVNMALQQAARNVLFEDDQLMQKFKFVVDSRYIEKKDTLGRSSKWHTYNQE